MKTLKALGAAAVVDNLKMEADIAKLEVPVTLFQDLVESYRNDFIKSNIKRFNFSNMIIKREKRISRIVKRRRRKLNQQNFSV